MPSRGREATEVKNGSKEGLFVRLAREFGWRAYAIPVLAVITVWVLVDVVLSNEPTDPHGSAAAGTSSTLEQPLPADQERARVAATELPSGGNFTERGAGRYAVVGTPGASAGKGHEKVFTYVVEVEEGLNVADYGGNDAFAAMVDATLTNPKSWTHDKKFGFRHIENTPDAKPDLRIQLTSVGTTHELCGNDIGMETSCFYTDGNRVIINEARWVRGATPFDGDLGAYRQYLINHEVGHGIGYANHVPCTGNGDLAPIMMQQTLSLSNSELYKIDSREVYKDDGATCAANAWPFPHA